MRKQEFRFQTNLPSRVRRGSSSGTASPPAPLAIRKAPSGRRRKSRRQSHKFFKHLLRLAPQLAARPWGGSPPRPLCQKICYQTAQKTALCAPWEHPGGFGIRKSASNSGHSPLRGLGGGLGGGLGDASPARRGSRSRPPLRRPRPLRFERLRMSGSECGIHTAEAASALRSRKTERAAEEKPTPISHIFLAPAAPGTPTRRHALGRLPTPPPLPENLLLRLHRKLPSAPLRAPRRFRNPKIGQQLGAQPTPRFRVMSEAMSEAMSDPWPPFTFCRPFSFDSKLIW